MATTPYPFVANAVLTASQLNSTYNVPVSTKTASYTLVAADGGTRVTMNSASATTITVNASLFSAGDSVLINNTAAGGTCTITAGTCAVTTSGLLALAANAGGTLYFTSASAAIFFSSATASKVAQVVTARTATAVDSSTNVFVDTGLTATITPTLNTSTILVMVNQGGVQKTNANAGTGITLNLLRGVTSLIQWAAYISYTGSTVANFVGSASMDYLDSPATTSATTYKTQFYSTTNTATATVQSQSTVSSITLVEILA